MIMFVVSLAVAVTFAAVWARWEHPSPSDRRFDARVWREAAEVGCSDDNPRFEMVRDVETYIEPHMNVAAVLELLGPPDRRSPGYLEYAVARPFDCFYFIVAYSKGRVTHTATDPSF